MSLSHGVFLRNAHGQEVLLRPQSITWRTLGGSIDLYFYSGPSQAEVSKNYHTSTVGLPAMQQYFTLGYHQCRWGYQNWSEVAEVVANFERFEIPLENIWYVVRYHEGERDLTLSLGQTLTTWTITVTSRMTRTGSATVKEPNSWTRSTRVVGTIFQLWTLQSMTPTPTMLPTRTFSV
jgi:hypothetical protein